MTETRQGKIFFALMAIFGKNETANSRDTRQETVKLVGQKAQGNIFHNSLHKNMEKEKHFSQFATTF